MSLAYMIIIKVEDYDYNISRSKTKLLNNGLYNLLKMAKKTDYLRIGNNTLKCLIASQICYRHYNKLYTLAGVY